MRESTRLLRLTAVYLQRHKPLALALVALLATFVAIVTFSISHILNPDKIRKPWREHCSTQPWFDNSATVNVPPVDIFIGIMTTDARFERRQVIRNTYATFTVPRHEQTGQRFGNIQVKFILGRPHRKYAQRIAMEMELHNDIIVLDIPETMSSFKTLHFMRWAADNATVPVLYSTSPIDVRWKLADYVLKADDDTFIILDELERRLRMTPRALTYWGCVYLLTRPNQERLYGWRVVRTFA